MGSHRTEIPARVPGPGPETVGWVASGFPILVAALFAVLLGLLVAEKPDLLHLDVSPSLRSLGALLAGLALSTFILASRAFGLCLLVAFVYLNLSQVLVRVHELPSLLQLLVLPLFLSGWAGRDGAGLRRTAREPLTILLVLYALVLLFSTALARDRGLADERVFENLKALAVYVLVAMLASSAALIKRGVWTLLGAGALLGGLGVVQSLTGNFSQEYGGLARIKNAQIYGDVFEPRIAGPLGDPNFFAQILLVLAPLALAVAWDEKRRSRKVLALASAAVIVAGTALTYSRGGALALACVLALSLLARRVHLRQVAIGAALVALLALVLPAGFASRLTTIEQILPGGEEALHPDSSFEKRKLLTTVAWRIFLDHPVLGVGAANYTRHFDDYAGEVGFASRDYEEPDERHYPHNLYLEIGAETGLLGLIAFGAATLVSLADLRRARAAFLGSGDAPSAGLARGFEIALVGYLLSSLFLHGHFQRYLWLLFGFSAALKRASAEEGA